MAGRGDHVDLKPARRAPLSAASTLSRPSYGRIWFGFALAALILGVIVAVMAAFGLSWLLAGSDFQAPVPLTVVIFLTIAFAPALLMLALRYLIYRRRVATFRATNRNDYHRSVVYRNHVRRIVSAPEEMFDTRLDNQYSGLRLVEVSRHFDQSLMGSISGTVSTFVGTNGSPGFFLGGQITSTIRANLLADAVMAIFETPGGEVVRLVTPSTPRVRELFEERVGWLANRFEPGSHCHTAVRDSASWISTAITTQVSHVSDRLHAIADRKSVV